MNTFFWGVGLFLALGSVLLATPGGEDLDLLSMGVPAADLALAESGSARRHNPFGGFYNPATVPHKKRFTVYSSQGQIADQVDLFALTTVWSWDTIGFSLAWIQLQVGRIPLVASDNVDANRDVDPDAFSHYAAQGLVCALSMPISDSWFFGVSVMGYLKSLDKVSQGQSYGYSLTPGVQGLLAEQLVFGTYIRHLFSQDVWGTKHGDVFLPEWHSGFMYTYGPLSLLGEWVVLPKSTYEGYGRVGAELFLGEHLCIRGGYQKTHVNAGLGLSWGPVSVDYVFIGSSEQRYGESSRLSVGMVL